MNNVNKPPMFGPSAVITLDSAYRGKSSFLLERMRNHLKKAKTMQDDLPDANLIPDWYALLADCNRDPGFPHSWAAADEVAALQDRWRKEYPLDADVPRIMENRDDRTEDSPRWKLVWPDRKT